MWALAVGWGEQRARHLARALGDGWAVVLAESPGAAARHLAAHPADGVLLAPGGPLDELRALLDACAAPEVPLYVCPPETAEGAALELLAARLRAGSGRWGPVEAELLSKAAKPRAGRMGQGTKELLLFLACLVVAVAVLAGRAARLGCAHALLNFVLHAPNGRTPLLGVSFALARTKLLQHPVGSPARV